jgi:hypothetical protein
MEKVNILPNFSGGTSSKPVIWKTKIGNGRIALWSQEVEGTVAKLYPTIDNTINGYK